MLSSPLHNRSSNTVTSKLRFGCAKDVAALFFGIGRQEDGVAHANDVCFMNSDNDILLKIAVCSIELFCKFFSSLDKTRPSKDKPSESNAAISARSESCA
jgi:hypothetical protein